MIILEDIHSILLMIYRLARINISIIYATVFWIQRILSLRVGTEHIRDARHLSEQAKAHEKKIM
jgi:hypothetical protein